MLKRKMFSYLKAYMLISFFGIIKCQDVKSPVLLENLINIKFDQGYGDSVRKSLTGDKNKSEGIWIGERPLNSTILKHIVQDIIPGININHAGVMINGIVYDLVLDSIDTTKFKIEITDSEKLKAALDWKYTGFSKRKVLKSEEDLRKKAKDLERKKYSTIPIGDYVVNCQDMVLEMISFATGYSKKFIYITTLVTQGTIIS